MSIPSDLKVDNLTIQEINDLKSPDHYIVNKDNKYTKVDLNCCNFRYISYLAATVSLFIRRFVHFLLPGTCGSWEIDTTLLAHVNKEIAANRVRSLQPKLSVEQQTQIQTNHETFLALKFNLEAHISGRIADFIERENLFTKPPKTPVIPQSTTTMVDEPLNPPQIDKQKQATPKKVESPPALQTQHQEVDKTPNVEQMPQDDSFNGTTEPQILDETPKKDDKLHEDTVNGITEQQIVEETPKEEIKPQDSTVNGTTEPQIVKDQLIQTVTMPITEEPIVRTKINSLIPGSPVQIFKKTRSSLDYFDSLERLMIRLDATVKSTKMKKKYLYNDVQTQYGKIVPLCKQILEKLTQDSEQSAYYHLLCARAYGNGYEGTPLKNPSGLTGVIPDYQRVYASYKLATNDGKTKTHLQYIQEAFHFFITEGHRYWNQTKNIKSKAPEDYKIAIGLYQCALCFKSAQTEYDPYLARLLDWQLDEAASVTEGYSLQTCATTLKSIMKIYSKSITMEGLNLSGAYYYYLGVTFLDSFQENCNKSEVKTPKARLGQLEELNSDYEFATQAFRAANAANKSDPLKSPLTSPLNTSMNTELKFAISKSYLDLGTLVLNFALPLPPKKHDQMSTEERKAHFENDAIKKMLVIAKNHYKEVIEVDPENPKSYVHLSVIKKLMSYGAKTQEERVALEKESADYLTEANERDRKTTLPPIELKIL